MIGTATPVHRRITLAAGIAYVLTIVSIPTLALYGTVRRCELRHRHRRIRYGPAMLVASWRLLWLSPSSLLPLSVPSTEEAE